MASSVTFVVEKDKIGGLPQAVRAALSKLVEETAQKVEAGAKEHAPVDTGFLRNGITHQMENPLTAMVSVGADYSADVEFGTIKAGAQPFLTPAVEAERADFHAGIGDAISTAAQ